MGPEGGTEVTRFSCFAERLDYWLLDWTYLVNSATRIVTLGHVNVDWLEDIAYDWLSARAYARDRRGREAGS